MHITQQPLLLIYDRIDVFMKLKCNGNYKHNCLLYIYLIYCLINYQKYMISFVL